MVDFPDKAQKVKQNNTIDFNLTKIINYDLHSVLSPVIS